MGGKKQPPERPEAGPEGSLFRVMADAAPVLIWISGTDKRCTYFNEPWLRFRGRTLEQEAGGGWAEGVHPDDLECCIRTYAEAFDRREPFQMEYRLQRHDGVYRWVLDNGVPRFDQRGAFTGYIGSCVDVTDLHRADEAARASEARRAAMLEASLDAVLSIDHRGVVLEANPAVQRILGFAPESLVGRQMAEVIIPARYRRKHYEGLARYLEEGVGPILGKRVEMAALRADGTEIPVELSVLRIPGVEPPVFTGYMRDLRKLKQRQAQMLQAQKLESLGVLAGGIAHDFNNLLTGVLGHAALAASELPAGHPAARAVREVTSSAQRAASLARQVLAYSGRGAFQIVPMDLSEEVREISGLLSASIPKHVQLRLDLRSGLPPIEADPAQIQQVVMNLVINAAESITGDSGAVTVQTGSIEIDAEYARTVFADDPLPAGTYAFLEVQDTGCGMSQDVIARIFDPFFTTKRTGRGLGLSAVLGIVRGHGGAVKVYSHAGQGTCFKVLLPIKAGAALHGAPRIQASELRGEGLVLVIDDERSVRDVLDAGLRRHGYDVLCAENGAEGLEIFKARKAEFVAVMLDLTMPVMSGADTFRALRLVRPDIRVVLISGYNEVETTRGFLAKGLAGFLQKPFTPEDVARKLREVLSLRRGSRSGGAAEQRAD